MLNWNYQVCSIQKIKLRRKKSERVDEEIQAGPTESEIEKLK